MTKQDRREQELVLRRLRADAWELVRAFALPLRGLDAERPSVRRRYGVCDSDGNIRIRLRHATTGRLLKYSSLVDTLCHELAHLRYFDHGPRFRAFYFRLLDNARRRGIYRPTPRAASSLVPDGGRQAPVRAWQTPARGRLPVQLDLFGSSAAAARDADPAAPRLL